MSSGEKNIKRGKREKWVKCESEGRKRWKLEG
jgi:hypothetical protein